MAMPPPPKPLDSRDWSLLLLLSLLWGVAFLCVGAAVRELPPLTVVLSRLALAAVVLLPVFWRYGHTLPRTLVAWTPFLVMGILNNILPFGLFTTGQTLITTGLASIINAMTPLFAVVVMAAFGEERLTAHRIAGVLLGAAGVAILQGADPLAGTGHAIGIALCLGGTLSYAFAALWGRRHLAGVAPLKSATCQLIASAVIMLCLVALVDRPWSLAVPSPTTWIALFTLAMLGTALAYIVFFELLVRSGASNAMLVTLLIPVTAILLGHLLLGEALHGREIVGALVIGLGLLFIDGRVMLAARRLLGGRSG